MKILQLTNTYTPIVGGVERSIRSFTTEFQKKGHEVIIVAPSFEGMPKKEEGVVRLAAIQNFNHTDFSVNLPVPGIVTKLMHDFKPDVVHSHHPFLIGDIALRLCGQYDIPLVFTYHTMFEEYIHYLPFHNELVRRFVVELSAGYANLADQVVVPTESVRSILEGRGVESPMAVIPTGIDVERFSRGDRQKIRKALSIPPEVFVVGHIGRLAPEKNLAFLAEAIVCFLKKAKSAHFLIGGQGPMESVMRKIFHDQGVSRRVHFVGLLHNQRLVDAYHAMDIFAFASTTETQGVVLTEAMAAGVPVVAVDALGSRDIIKDGENGCLVLRQDNDDFVKALCWCANRRFNDFLRMKQLSLKVAERFSAKQSAREVLSIYQNVKVVQDKSEQTKHTVWSTVLHRIKTEWEMAKNFAEAGGAALRSSRKHSHHPVEHWILKGRRFLRKSAWASRFLKLSQHKGSQTYPGLVLIQIDGLSKKQLERAMKEGSVPFLKRLIKREHYRLHPFYSGMPSSTPSVQGELFYGVKQAVPAFAFFDHKVKRIFRMYDGDAAVVVEQRLADGPHQNLLDEGSSYSNVFSGGAKEMHFCAVSLGLHRLWKNVNIVGALWFMFTHAWTLIWTTICVVLEFVLALLDCIYGILKGYNWRKELKFVLTRPAICILLRNLITLGAIIDVERGLPIIHMNFLGFDEQAHRRGPSSRFAHHALPGIDRVIAKIYYHALHSSRRNYDVWIYSDHGQEDVISYWKKYGKSVRQKVAEVFTEFESMAEHRAEHNGMTAQRFRYFGKGFLQRLFLGADFDEKFIKGKLVVTAIGPTANVYFPRKLSCQEKESFAKRLVAEAHIPLVLVPAEGKHVDAFNRQGKFSLPEDARTVLGDHPYLEKVTKDLIQVCHHPDAGSFTLCGWRPDAKSYSFPIENGSHAGPGIEETNAFALVPADIHLNHSEQECVLTKDIRRAALRHLGRMSKNKIVVDPLQKNIIRIMTYNVHSCVGMDGKIIPERIARVIGRYEPDIVALQELDVSRKRTGGVDQAYIIAKHLEMMYHFHPSICLEEEQYGDAILSRYPMQLIKAGELPGQEMNAKWEPRGAIWAVIHIDEKRHINIINTHLGLRTQERLKQVKFLIGSQWLGHKDCQGPTVFCGDFNAMPNSLLCRNIKKEGFRDIQEDLDGHKAHSTWFSQCPIGRIDHIFVGPGIKVAKVEIAKTKLDRLASDHLPLVAEIYV
ncbi:hypothetical protein MNBD_UNCLBAC01-1263 [hydrothermal vent metagenome]|uniref:Glycosyltransferase n=1 Tax=hydrothermal vent metagenome TaxID=652676 RepID=A0A3B1D3L9_9ZZZZ